MNKTTKILCIEDNPEIQLIVQAALKPIIVESCSTLKEAESKLTLSSFDLLLLDLGLPDSDGLNLFVWIEEHPQFKKIPVFVLTAKNETINKTQAFSLGADDFITKPFDPQELKARVLAKLKKISDQNVNQDIIKIGLLNIFVSTQKVYLSTPQGPEPLDLTSIEFRLLCILSKNPEKTFSRSELLQLAWGDHVNITDRTVDTHIGNLRKKIKNSQVSIETVVNVGYRIQT